MPERGEPRERQRGAHRRHARRRRRRRSTPVSRADGRVDRAADAEARDRRSSRCRSTRPMLVRPRSALGLKYVEITQGHVEPRASRTARPIPLAQRDARAGRDRRGPQHVRRADARGVAARTSTSSAPRSPAAAQDLNAAHRGAHPLLRNLVPVMREPRPTRGRDLRRLRPRRSGSAAPSVAPVAETQAALFREPRHDLRARSPTCAPAAGDDQPAAPPALDAAIRGFPVQRPFLANSERPVRRAAPGRRARCAPPRPTSPTRSRSARRSLRRSVALNEPPRADVPRAAGVRRGPAVALGVNGLTQHGRRSSTRRSPTSRPSRRSATT